MTEEKDMQQEAVSEEKVNEANTEAEADVEAANTEETKEASGGKDEKKKKRADKKEQAYEEKIAELNDRVMRQMAEFDNYRKRTEKEKSQMFEIGAKDIIEKVLPVVDNFERGLSALSEEEKESAFTQGIEKIYKQLTQVLADAGVEPIEAVGKEFNPDFHNAVMHAEDENLGENIVAEEFQKGYTYRGSVVRHSMVKVVN